MLATPWIVSGIAWRVPGTWALPIQACANRINAQAAQAPSRNARLGWLDWVAVLIGGAFFGWVLDATIAPPVPARATVALSRRT